MVVGRGNCSIFFRLDRKTGVAKANISLAGRAVSKTQAQDLRPIVAENRWNIRGMRETLVLNSFRQEVAVVVRTIYCPSGKTDPKIQVLLDDAQRCLQHPGRALDSDYKNSDYTNSEGRFKTPAMSSWHRYLICSKVAWWIVYLLVMAPLYITYAIWRFLILLLVLLMFVILRNYLPSRSRTTRGELLDERDLGDTFQVSIVACR